MLENANPKRSSKRWYRKKIDLLTILEKIKLWPSRTGRLHGLKSIERQGDELAIVTTHCGRSFKVRNSRNSRAARWLRSKLYQEACPACKVPDWKLSKYGATFFSRRQGSLLNQG